MEPKSAQRAAGIKRKKIKQSLSFVCEGFLGHRASAVHQMRPREEFSGRENFAFMSERVRVASDNERKKKVASSKTKRGNGVKLDAESLQVCVLTRGGHRALNNSSFFFFVFRTYFTPPRRHTFLLLIASSTTNKSANFHS